MAQATRQRTELKVTPREIRGKKVRALRREGLTPANIYGPKVESTAVQVLTEELRQVLKTAGRNDIVYLRLDGDEPRPTFVRDIQQNPVTDAILHVDFFQISLRDKVRADVPIHLVGLSPAVDTFGGILMHGLDHVTVEALPTEVPSFLELDVSPQPLTSAVAASARAPEMRPAQIRVLLVLIDTCITPDIVSRCRLVAC